MHNLFFFISRRPKPALKTSISWATVWARTSQATRAKESKALEESLVNIMKSSTNIIYYIVFIWHLDWDPWINWQSYCRFPKGSIMPCKFTHYLNSSDVIRAWRHSLFSRYFRMKNSTLRITGLLWGEPPVTIGFPSQKDSNSKSVFMSRCYHFNHDYRNGPRWSLLWRETTKREIGPDRCCFCWRSSYRRFVDPQHPSGQGR